jgi:tRNA pseudouridine55 synthase
MTGIIIIDKPRGWTSHDVVQKIRRLFQEKQIGHTGTLDPLATGVLVLCMGKATRIVRYLQADDKEYHAELKLGVRTDTQDADGRVIETRQYLPPSRDDVERTILGFRGNIVQRPPLFSAVKIKGVPAYHMARKGLMPELRERMVTIHDIRLLDYADPLIRFTVTCSKGTYIRTLCDEIGIRIGCGAHLTSLRRSRAGKFLLDQAWSMDRISTVVASGSHYGTLTSLNDALADRPGVTVTADEAKKILHGNPIRAHRLSETIDPAAPLRLSDAEGHLLAIGVLDEGMIRPEVVLR